MRMTIRMPLPSQVPGEATLENLILDEMAKFSNARSIPHIEHNKVLTAMQLSTLAERVGLALLSAVRLYGLLQIAVPSAC